MSIDINETIRVPGSAPVADEEVGTTPGAGDLNERLMNESVWTDAMVHDAGIPIVDVPMVSVGGGIGSFVMSEPMLSITSARVAATSGSSAVIGPSAP